MIRILPKDLGVELDASTWPIPEIFTWIKLAGNVKDFELQKTFNCGLGMVLIVDPNEVNVVQKIIKDNGEDSFVVGKVIKKQDRSVVIKNFAQNIQQNQVKFEKKIPMKKRVAVLISGSGTNLKAIIEYVQKNVQTTTINLALVISNKSSAPGNQFALDAGIPLKILVKKKIQTREEYDQQLTNALEEANIEVVCLAGFMQLLSEQFVNYWSRKMINIHPSLLPSFKGMDAYGQALEYGVKITGCTVHFVVPEMDAGPIISQGVVHINPNETHESLVERGKAVEHIIYPKALEMVTSNKAIMSNDGKTVIFN